MSNLVIIAKPNLLDSDCDKFYVLRSNGIEEVTLIGDVAVEGSIVGIGNTYEEARTIFKNLAR